MMPRMSGRRDNNVVSRQQGCDGETNTGRIANGVGGFMADAKIVIEQAYSAFNKRDIDGALALMTEDVS
jgi:hypothetical protein